MVCVTPFLNSCRPVISADAGRRAGRADVEVGEANAFVMQPVEVGRLEDRVAVAGQIAVALVVGEDEDDVRAAADERFGRETEARSNRDE